MDIWDNLVQIRKELRRGELEKAIFLMEDWMNTLPPELTESLKELSDQVIHLSSQFFQAKKRDQMRLISTLDLNIINNNITNGLLEVCREVEGEILRFQGEVASNHQEIKVLVVCNKEGLSIAKHLKESLQELINIKILLI